MEKEEEELGHESVPVNFERVSSPVVSELFEEVERSSSLFLRESPSQQYLSVDGQESAPVTFDRVSSPEFIQKFREPDLSQLPVMVTDSDGNSRWFNGFSPHGLPGVSALDLGDSSANNLAGEGVSSIESHDSWDQSLMLWNTLAFKHDGVEFKDSLSLKEMVKQMSESDDAYVDHPFGRSFVENLHPLSDKERRPPYNRPPLRRFLFNLKLGLMTLRSNFRVFIDRYTKPAVKRDEYQEGNVYLTSNGLEERLYGGKTPPDLLKASEEAEKLLFSSLHS